MKASVIVVVHSGEDRLDDAPQSLAAYRENPEVEVVIVDNGAPEGCGRAAEQRFPWATVVHSDRNLGFAGGANLGAEAASGDVLVLLNDDAWAEDGFVEAHLEVLAAHPGAAASAGRLTTWDGERHDFVRGMVTFDCHAFQVGQGFPVTEQNGPEAGEPVAVACGGNMAVRRTDWLQHGGFDAELFAYFEDVELCWRLLASGRDIVAAPDAVARHRGSATSDALGNFRRGVLFERNALRTFFACADDELRSAMGPAVVMTFLHRLACSTDEDTALGSNIADPFRPSGPPLSRAQRWRRRLREKGAVGALRHLAARVLLGPSVGLPTLEDGRLLMQLRAARGLVEGFDRATRRRTTLAGVRKVSDRELITRFPRLIVPTYPGDEQWFDSAGFGSLMPDGWAVERRSLDSVLHSSVLNR